MRVSVSYFSPVIALLCASMLCFATPGYAENSEPLWQKAQNQIKASKQWFAKNIEETIVAAKDGDESKTLRQSKQFEQWKDGEAVYVVTKTSVENPKAKDGKQPNFIEMFASFDQELVAPEIKFKRLADETLQGKTKLIFEVQLKEGGSSKIWLDKSSERLEQRVDSVSMAFMLDAAVTTQYVHDEAGNIMVAKVHTKVDVKIPFKKMKMEITAAQSNFEAKPKKS